MKGAEGECVCDDGAEGECDGVAAADGVLVGVTHTSGPRATTAGQSSAPSRAAARHASPQAIIVGLSVQYVLVGKGMTTEPSGYVSVLSTLLSKLPRRPHVAARP